MQFGSLIKSFPTFKLLQKLCQDNQKNCIVIRKETRVACCRNASLKEAASACCLTLCYIKQVILFVVYTFLAVSLHMSLLHSHTLCNPACHLLCHCCRANTTHLRVNYSFLLHAGIVLLITAICLRRSRSKQCICNTITSELCCCVVLLYIKYSRRDVSQPELKDVLIMISPGSLDEAGDGWQVRCQNRSDVSVNHEQHHSSHNNIMFCLHPNVTVRFSNSVFLLVI